MCDSYDPELDLQCPWCGEDFPDKKAHDKHYRVCVVESEIKLTPDDVFNLINNPKNY